MMSLRFVAWLYGGLFILLMIGAGLTGCVTEQRGDLATSFASPMAGGVAAVGCLRVEHQSDASSTQGTGFLIASNLVATCLHVVNGADAASITFPSGVVRPITGVVGSSVQNDLAVLTIDPVGSELLPLAVSCTPAIIGQELVVHGYPVLGDTSPRISSGTTTYVAPCYGVPAAIVTTVNLSHGFSGGPALDRQQRVCGIAMAGVSGVTVDGKRFTGDQGLLVPASNLVALARGVSQTLRVWTKCRGDIAYSAARVSEGQNAIEKGDRAKAIICFKKAVLRDPDNMMGWYQLGQSLEAIGHDSDALNAYLRALNLNPRMPEILAAAGNLQRKKGQLSQAIKTLELALRLSPDCDQIRFCLGVACLAALDANRADEMCETMKLTSPDASAFILKGVQEIDSVRSSKQGGVVSCEKFVRIADNAIAVIRKDAQDGKVNKQYACYAIIRSKGLVEFRYCQLCDQDAQVLFSNYLRIVSEVCRSETSVSGSSAGDWLDILNLAIDAISRRVFSSGVTSSQAAWIKKMTSESLATIMRTKIDSGVDLETLLATPQGEHAKVNLAKLGIFDEVIGGLAARR